MVLFRMPAGIEICFLIFLQVLFRMPAGIEIFLCSPKNFGGAYSRRFVRASVRPCVRASVRPCVRPALVHANSRKLLVGFQ